MQSNKQTNLVFDLVLGLSLPALLAPPAQGELLAQGSLSREAVACASVRLKHKPLEVLTQDGGLVD